MRALVIEDELLAREHMIKLLQDNFPEVEVVGAVGSIKDATAWITEQPAPDVIFMDVELSDGTSFDIFTQVEIPCPVVMTTAYDQYAVQAFVHDWERSGIAKSLEFAQKVLREQRVFNL